MKTVVVGVADTETADEAARQAADLAQALGATLHLVSAVSGHGIKSVTSGGDSWAFSDHDAAQDHIRIVQVRLGDEVEFSSAVVHDDPAKALVSEAERLEADVIVVGSVRTQGIGRVLGSVAGDVLKQAPCGVFVAKTT